MTKKEIAKLVYASTDLSQVDAQTAVQATFESLTKVLLKFGRVELRGFGVFAIQTRAARKARNPRTGEEVFVDEHETVVFKPSKIVKDKLDAQRVRKAKAVKSAKASKSAKKTETKATEKKAVKATAKKAAPKAAKKTTKK